MISICIPVYNYPVSRLVQALSDQASRLSVPVEIVLIDDGSAEEYRKMNEEACEDRTCVKLEQNVGRAAIRNMFPEYARYDHLLYLDCDVEIADPGFLEKYLDVILEYKPPVVCGGRLFPEGMPPRKYRLRWVYGKKRESRPAEARRADPGRSFMTHNFLVERKIMEQVRFDERITGYGHEDTLYGFNLKKSGIPVMHIDNPVLNGDLESNREFLEKTRQGVENLAVIFRMVEDKETFSQDVRLLQYYMKIETRGKAHRTAWWFAVTGPLVRVLLSAGITSLKLFDFYKLGLLIRVLKKYR